MAVYKIETNVFYYTNYSGEICRYFTTNTPGHSNKIMHILRYTTETVAMGFVLHLCVWQHNLQHQLKVQKLQLQIKDLVFRVSLIAFALGITFFAIDMVKNQN